MKQSDVPQEKGLLAGQREVSYAVAENGSYTLQSSVGWDAKTVALKQAWETIEEQLQDVIATVKAGKQSPLAYHMVKHQMDPTLLAQYSGIARWKVKRHLKPSVFKKLNERTLQIYCTLFSMTKPELQQVPEKPVVPLEIRERVEANRP